MKLFKTIYHFSARLRFGFFTGCTVGGFSLACFQQSALESGAPAFYACPFGAAVWGGFLGFLAFYSFLSLFRFGMKAFSFIFFFLLLPVCAHAQATIGVDSTFAIEPLVFLNTGTPEAGVFNYFFTLEIFAGMVALFIRICLKVLKL